MSGETILSETSTATATAQLQYYEKYSRKELNRQFSPNLWNPKKDIHDVAIHHYRFSDEGTKKARRTVPCKLDYPYGTEAAQLFDIYGTDLPANAPVFFWVHGGGWQIGSKNISGFFAPNLHRRGFKTIVFGYTLAPEAKITEMIYEVRDGLRAAFRLFPNSKFVVAGHSAGAHLVSSIIHDDETNYSQVERVLLFSGVYDMRPFAKTVFNLQTKLTEDEAVRVSPVLKFRVNRAFLSDKTKIIAIVGELESPEFKRQAKLYSDILKGLGASSEYWVSELDDHFSIIESLADEKSSVAQQTKQFTSNIVAPKISRFFKLCNL